MNEQQQAEALAAWLAAGGKAPLPEGLDPDVLEGLWALRPELAPPPRLDVDTILAEVGSGPLAPQQAPTAVAEPLRAAPSPVVPAPPVPTPANRRWGWLAGAGTLAAAAVAVLVIGVQPDPARFEGEVRLEEAARDAAVAPLAAPPTELEVAPPPGSAAPRPSADVAGSTEARTNAAPSPSAAPPPAKRSAPLEEAAQAPGAPAAGYDAGGAPPPTASSADGLLGAASGAPASPATPARERSAKAEAQGASTRNAAAPTLRQEALSTPMEAEMDAAEDEAKSIQDLAPTSLAAVLVTARARAQSDPLGAASLLRPWIRLPAADGHRAAYEAARFAIQGGDRVLAQVLVQEGLALRGTGPQRQLLEDLARTLPPPP